MGKAAHMARRRKYEEIAEHLELSIVSGQLRTGERIPSERELMDRFEAGRSSVREALFTLQRKGLLSATAGAVARVTEPTADVMVQELSGIARLLLSRPDGVRELQEARSLFETGLARQAARRAGPEACHALRIALDANATASDQEAFVTTDIEFHAEIARICGNRSYLAISAAFSDWLHEQRVVSARAGVTRDQAVAQHREIYQAIAAGDPVAAEDAMEAHLETVARFYWKGVSGQGFGTGGTI